MPKRASKSYGLAQVGHDIQIEPTYATSCQAAGMASGYLGVSNTLYLLQTRTSSSSNFLFSGSQYLFVLAQQMR
jgi:hypothetical protein